MLIDLSKSFFLPQNIYTFFKAPCNRNSKVYTDDPPPPVGRASRTRILIQLEGVEGARPTTGARSPHTFSTSTNP